MKTKEFIKAVKELGYEAVKYEERISIKYKDISIANVFTDKIYQINSNSLNKEWGEKGGVLFALIFQYACTPIKDREEKEKEF